MASTPTRDLPEEFLAATRKSQEAMIHAIKTWVETVRTVTPKLPSAYADRLASLPSVTLPFADKLPKPEDVVASGYDFAEHLLAIQRKFAEDLLQVTEPLIPANARRAWQDATKADTAAEAEKPVAAAQTAVTETAEAAQKAIADVTPKPVAPAAQVTPSAQKAVATTTPKTPAVTVRKAPAAKAAPKPVGKPAPKATPAAKAAPKPDVPKPDVPKPDVPKPDVPKPAVARPAVPEPESKTEPKPATEPRAPKGDGTS